MKKITLALMFALGLNEFSFGQANIAIQAPPFDGSTTGLSLPNAFPAVVYHRSCYLILQTELTSFALTNSVITTLGLDLQQSCNVATSGQFTVYMSNTSDVAYNKGTTWSNILSTPAPMQVVYQGALNFPVNSGATTVPLTLTSNFNYTGGGIYVACDWYSAAPTATLPVRTLANSSGLNTPAATGGGCYGSASVTPAPATLTNTTNFRPCFRFTAANTATNEVSITRFDAPGKVSKLFSAGHVITAQIRNNSNVTLNNVPVTLSVGGANTFSDTKTVTSIAAGSFSTVSFSPFNPTAGGANTMTVTVPPDQVLTNNLGQWTQTVTCNDFATIPPIAAAAFTDSPYGWNTSGGIYSYKMTPPSNCTLTAMSMVVATGTGIVGNTMYGVLMDAAGAIVATSQTVTLSAAMQGTTFTNFTFDPPQALAGGTSYYFGMAQPAATTQFYPFANIQPPYTIQNFYLHNIAGGGTPTQADRGYIAFGANLTFPNSSIEASASKTVVCKAGATVTLTATGADTYTWTSATGPVTSTAGVAKVTPTIAATQGVVKYFAIGTNTTVGCKSPQSVVTISLAACVGISENGDANANVKVFPNPALAGKAVVNGLEGTNTISLINVLGQTVQTVVSDEESVSIDLSNQPVGNYMIKITDSTNKSRMVKLVVQN